MKVNWNFTVDIMILTIILGITAGWTDAAEAIMRPPAEYDFCAKSAIQDATDDYLANPDLAKFVFMSKGLSCPKTMSFFKNCGNRSPSLPSPMCRFSF